MPSLVTRALTTALALPALGLGLTACDPQHPIDIGEPGLEALYVSGHFGSYHDCPEEAFENLADPRDGDRAPAAIRDGAAPDADCDGDDCGLLNCEPARLMVQLENTTTADALDVEVRAVVFLDLAGEPLAELPISAVHDATGAAFEGTVAAGDVVQLDLDFVGPYNVAAMLDIMNGEGLWAGQGIGATVRVEFASSSHEAPRLETPELFSLPIVDT